MCQYKTSAFQLKPAQSAIFVPLDRSLIQLLPEALANQIAAGEVVQRPASAVKELLENALDAGATHIRLVIQDAGKKLIQVVDNGCGMGPTDARMCFERHATSKIRSIEDLFSVRTMGFRGEALASIAAVAQVELKTRTHDAELGSQITIAGGQYQGQQPVQMPQGTIMSVRNLFFNVPARRNFLKSNPVEFRHILTEFYHLALSEPQIHLVLENNGQVELDLPPADTQQRYLDLHPPLKTDELVPIHRQSASLRISGYIGVPQVARKTRGQQYIFVNGRYIRSPFLHHALMLGYGETLPKEHHPPYVLYLELDPTLIDINIHPTKQEIKFQDEQEHYKEMLAAIRQGLGSLHHLQLPTQLQGDEGAVHTEIYGHRPNEGLTLGQARHTQGQPAPRNFNWEELYPPELRETPRHQVLPIREVETPLELFVAQEADTATHRISPRYLLHRRPEGLYFIDIERAHRRILYEGYLTTAQRGPLPVQRLLYPLVFQFDGEDFLLLKEALPDLQRMGFDLLPTGRNELTITGTPFHEREEDLRLLLEGLLSLLKESGEIEDTVRDTLARGLARRQAISAGSTLSHQEQQRLVHDLWQCREPAFTPNGEPVWHFMNWAHIDKQLEKS